MRLVALDWVNFLLADVRGGLGAYVIVYLVTERTGARRRSAPCSPSAA